MNTKSMKSLGISYVFKLPIRKCQGDFPRLPRILSQTYKLGAAAGQVGPPGRVLLAVCEQPGLRSARALPNPADPFPEDSPGTAERLDSLESPGPRPAAWPDPAWCPSTASITSRITSVDTSKEKGTCPTAHSTAHRLTLISSIISWLKTLFSRRTS